MALLKSKSANKTKTISVRVPIVLAEELDVIKRHADKHGLAFDVADVVERALTQATRAARSELAALPTTKQPAVAA